MFGGGLFSIFFRGVVIVGSDLFTIVVLSSKSEGRLSGSTFLMHFILFGESF